MFPEDIRKWCTEEIQGTDIVNNFPEGKATQGWYKGFLRRQGFLTGSVRPLEMTRAEWFTEDNLRTYYDVAAGVLTIAGVAEPNTSFNPNLPYSEQLIITHPERIVSFDESKLEVDGTRGGKGKTDRITRVGIEDDGECTVPKSDKVATATCGRIGDGKALPAFIVFNSGEEFDVAWAPHYESDIIDPRTGNKIAWRYSSNHKGSMTEDLCCDYMEKVLYPAVGCPPHRDDKPGEQGVIICDGVGTHTGMQALRKAIELGCEVILRVPHLSFVLQGEDTVNFKDLKVGCCLSVVRCYVIGY